MDDWKRKVCDRGGKVSVEFVELGVVGHWRRRLDDRGGALLSMLRGRWWRGIGGWMDGWTKRARERPAVESAA